MCVHVRSAEERVATTVLSDEAIGRLGVSLKPRPSSPCDGPCDGLEEIRTWRDVLIIHKNLESRDASLQDKETISSPGGSRSPFLVAHLAALALLYFCIFEHS